VLVIIELVIEKHISNRRLFSEAIVALVGGAAFGTWSAVFREQAGALSAEKLVWDLSVPLGVALVLVVALLFAGTYFLARRISVARWRDVLEYEDLLE
jgi:uncharacterized BrkB/YihY/UPF0761 family membrane protein